MVFSRQVGLGEAQRYPEIMRSKLLYLGFEFWPGHKELPEGAPKTGHIFQAEMMEALEQHFDVRYACSVPDLAIRGGGDTLHLYEKFPEVWNRFQALRRLKRQYLSWQSEGWVPDAVMFYNFIPMFCPFLRWLGMQARTPKRILLLADSNRLGREMSGAKRLRYHLKPFAVFEDEMLGYIEGCISLSQATEPFFAPRKTPWLWMPGACKPERALTAAQWPASGPVQFGYFGRLSADPGTPDLLKAFHGSRVSGSLHLWGYGDMARELQEQARANRRIEYHGEAPNPDDYVRLAQACDVLGNPRPMTEGNQNNFPSKLFAYALSGRAILTTGFGGAKEVLGPEAFYIDESRFEASLIESLEQIGAMPRAELQRRGAAIQQRVLGEYSWRKQAEKMAGFIASF
jgi:glycosyltransferase involved in cell wall biosynthesis